MKYIKLFEAFKKEYMKKIDLKDFKKIKKGTKLTYMGGPAEVMDNNGYVLTLKGDNGKTFTVNKAQFDHGGFIKESAVTEIRRSSVSGTMSGSVYSLEDRKYELKKDVNGARIGDFTNVTLPKGTIIYNLPGGLFADHSSLKSKYTTSYGNGPKWLSQSWGQGVSIRQMPETLSSIEKNSKVLESVVDTAFESSSSDGGDKSNGNSHHDDHQTKSIAQHWKDIYGEEFHSKYPAIAKIVKSRPGIDKRELKRIWDETYGENFEEQYPALWQKID
tara:strand:- start:200 stop:1021 length:822 start_codon:yes stop_codon:yes gene_type:complete